MNIFGQLINAQLENKAADYGTAGTAGRIWFNTATKQALIDDGVLLNKVLTNISTIVIGTNQATLIVGTSGTPANNIKLFRAANGVLQFVGGADATAEGTLSTVVNKLSFAFESYLDAGKPAVGNAGRIVFITDIGGGSLFYDNGGSWVALSNVGIPPWDVATTYSQNAIVIVSGVIYISLTNANLGNPVTDPTNWTVYGGKIAAKTANYTVDITDDLITLDATGGDFTLTLPAAIGTKGKKIYLKKIDDAGGTVTIARSSADLIDGETSQQLVGAMTGIIYVSDGISNWYSF